MNRCPAEGLLQTYFDGELSQESSRAVAEHLAGCGPCSEALANLEGESALFAASFAPDDSLAVPSEILRARVAAAVARFDDEKDAPSHPAPRGRKFGGLLASLSGLLTLSPRGAAAFASVLALVAAGVIYFAVVKRSDNAGNGRAEIARAEPPAPTVTPEAPPSRPNRADEEGDPAGVVTPPPPPSLIARAGTTSERRNVTRRAAATKAATTATPEAAAPELIPGEKNYRQAIASLETTIKMGGDSVLRPAVRVEYERNLAILDSAIAESRRVAARNPKDKDAVGFLMAAYEGKVELLTKVADQAQVAALGR